MSRRDTYHDVVKQALIKEGWNITHDPYIILTDPRLAVDLGAERTIAAQRANEKIAIEIKCFRSASQVADLQESIGQYSMYQIFLQRQEPDRRLYLAVPTYAIDDIFSREVGQVILESLKINLVVYSLVKEEPLQWKVS